MKDPAPFLIPQGFLDEIDRLHGKREYAWLETVPALLERATRQWSLTIDGDARHGAHGLVIPVRQNGLPQALKIAIPDEVTSMELVGLRAWNGRGVVRIVAADPDAGLLLMDRLDAARDLTSLRIDAAVQEAGRLARILAIAAPAQSALPTASGRAAEIANNTPASWERAGSPFPDALLHQTVALAHSLARRNPSTMTTWDLHSENVLWGDRSGWTLIDPMPLLGDPELALAPFLWTRTEEIAGPDHLLRLVQGYVASGQFDFAITRIWLAVRLVDYWLWGLGHGLTIDPERCSILLSWLDPLPDA